MFLAIPLSHKRLALLVPPLWRRGFALNNAKIKNNMEVRCDTQSISYPIGGAREG
jgi:hypothetical protein